MFRSYKIKKELLENQVNQGNQTSIETKITDTYQNLSNIQSQQNGETTMSTNQSETTTQTQMRAEEENESKLSRENLNNPTKKCMNCCEDYSTIYPYSFNIFLPGTKEIIDEFIVSRHRLTTSGLRCRLRFGLNTFENKCMYGKERVLRIEGMSKEEVINCVDLLDLVFPEWKVWRRGKADLDLI